MNKRYMDFVPKGKNIPAKKPVEVKKPVPVAEEPEVYTYTEKTVVTEEYVDATPDVAIEEFLAVDDNPRRRNEPEFGIIEEYKPKFVQTEIKKRPLGQPEVRPVPKEVPKPVAKPVNVAAEIKAQKIAARPFGKVKPAAVPKAPEVAPKDKEPKEETFKTPKPRFVNTEKVEKRPLSKNVYKKKIVVPKEEPTGPVTIITKPDKGSHIGVVVTIILTIILGAAAGTVAFLLLPK